MTQEAAAEQLGWSVAAAGTLSRTAASRRRKRRRRWRRPTARPAAGGTIATAVRWAAYGTGRKATLSLQQLALEGLEAEDYEQERRDAHDLARIALDRKKSMMSEYPRYQAIQRRMLRRAYLAEMASIAGETQVER